MKQIPFELFSRQYDLKTLGSGSIFGAISADATAFLLKNGAIYEAQEGEAIFQNGDQGDNFYIVCEGKLAFYKHQGERSFMTRTVGFGEEIGFVSMIALHPHEGRAVALEDSTVLKVSASLFSLLHQNYPMDFGLMLMNLARDLARNVRRLSDSVVEANLWDVSGDRDLS